MSYLNRDREVVLNERLASDRIFYCTTGDYTGTEFHIYRCGNGNYKIFMYEYGSCDECDDWLAAAEEGCEDDKKRIIDEMIEEGFVVASLHSAEKVLAKMNVPKKQLDRIRSLDEYIAEGPSPSF